MSILKNLSMATAGVVFIAPLHSIKAEAATINQISPAELSNLPGLINFDDVTGGPSPGTQYNAIFESGGANFGERFVGQTLSLSNENFDILSSTSTSPLTLQAGNPGQNLAVFIDRTTPNITNVLVGLSPVASNTNVNDGYGEGSFAVLFDFEQSEFGFDLLGGQNGSATVNFFRRNGSLLDTIVLNALSLGNTSYAFRRDGGIRDIAGISIHNNDPQGIAFENLRSDVPGVPGTPTPIPFEFSPSLGLLMLGAWGLGARLKSIVQKRKSFESGFSKN